MDRIWQWLWDRHATRYSWAIWVIGFPIMLQIYLVPSCIVVAFEGSGRYVQAVAVTVFAVWALVYVMVLPGKGGLRTVELWAAGRKVDRAEALTATYNWARKAHARGAWSNAAFIAILLVVVGVIAGAPESRVVQYGVLGAVIATAVDLTGVHSFAETMLRPARVAIAGDTGVGDSLPRSRPTFAAWSNVSVLAAVALFAIWAALLAAVIDRASEIPALSILIGLENNARLRGAVDHRS